MKAIRFWVATLIATLMVLGLTACSSDEKAFVDYEPLATVNGGNLVKGISVSLSDLVSANADTRTTYDTSGSGVKVAWAKNDTIGIFPSKGGQVEFPIEEGTGSKQALFDGGDWALKAGRAYAAYYPFNRWNTFRDNKTIQLDYTGQTQTGNDNSDHLVKYDYQATGSITTNANGYLNFQFEHMGALLKIELTVPKAGTYTSLTLTSSNQVFVTKAELDISGNEPVVKPVTQTNSITLSLKNVLLSSDNDVLTAYLMLAPTDLSSGTLEIALNGSSNYVTELNGTKLEAGKLYKIAKELATSGNNIVFADENVKAICVANWDTNGDGELSYDEAAAVNDIGTIFYRSLIKSFNELENFIGLNSIGDEAFYSCTSLTSITLPEGLNTIGEKAFYRCNSLLSITLPEGLNYIQESAFENCTSLTSITLPEELNGFGWYTFQNCSSLKSIIIPKGVGRISLRAFQNCQSLKDVTLQEGLIVIDNYAFQDCSSLVSITLPEGLDYIGNKVFYGCSSLTNITLPETLMSIGSEAFSGNSKLISIEIPSKVSSISGSTFKDCTSLKSVKLSANTYHIANDAFFGCTSLTSIDIPDCVSTIEDNAFAGCTSLTSVKLPTSITTLGHSAFKGCTQLGSVEMSESMTSTGFYAFANCSNLKDVTLPESMQTISGGAFNNCTSLKSIVLPQAVSSIGTSAFKSSKNLEVITVKNATPPTVESNAFSDTGIKTIYIPAVSVDAYKAADGWSAYADFIQAIPE